MIETYLPIFLTMFILIDPLGVAMVYLGLVTNKGLSPKEQRIVAVKAPLVALVVLIVFIFLGQQLISSLGILPGSLYVAGGVLLFIVSIDLLFGQPKRTTATEKDDQREDATEIAIFPLALPLLSGPGAITAILIFTSQHQGDIVFSLSLLAMVALVLLAAALSMISGELVKKILGKTGVSVIERIMGILLAGMSVQFVHNGIQKLITEYV